MFWNKKENKNALPDLPPMKSFPVKSEEYHEENHEDDNEDEFDDQIERHSLPSFPDSAMKKGFAQAAIKDAIDPSEEDEEIINSPSAKSFKAVEMDEEWSPQTPPSRQIAEIKRPTFEEMRFEESLKDKRSSIPAAPSTTISMAMISSPPPYSSKFSAKTPGSKEIRKSEIYVKIDKFYTARKTLETVKTQLMEIEDLLKRIRDTRLREDQELSSWEKEIDGIKERVKDVTENIFEKIE